MCECGCPCGDRGVIGPTGSFENLKLKDVAISACLSLIKEISHGDEESKRNLKANVKSTAVELLNALLYCEE